MIEKNIPTQSQVETLLSDWLEGTRDAETFVHKDTKGAIHRQAAAGKALSEYSRGNLDDLDEADLLRQARVIAQGVVDGMTDIPIRVTLGSTDSYTDGKSICVSTDYFDDANLTTGQKVDILTGYAIHEACHIRHSNFKELGRKRDENATVDRLKHDIDNILEDERIEHILGAALEDGGDGMPGLTDYIGCSKRRSFGSYKAELRGNTPTEKIPQFLDALLGAVRYPAMLTEEMVRRHFSELNEVRKILRPFPRSPKGVMAATDRIVEVMKQMLEDDKRSDERQDEHGQQDRQQDTAQSGSRSESGRQDAKTSHKKLAEALSTSQAETALRAMEKANNAPDARGNEARCIAANEQEKAYVNGLAEKDVATGAGGLNSVTYIRNARGDKNSYAAALSTVKRFVPAMAKALRCRAEDKDYVLNGEKTGKLNTNKLVSLKTGNTNIFSRRGTISSDKACICLLIDESGSMSGGRRKQASREAAVLINEAVRHITNLKLYVYGFTDDEITVYAENGREDRWALGTTRAKGGTPTADAMRVAAKRIRRQTADGCLMLVMTDGQPNDIQATMEQDGLLARQKFVVVGADLTGGESVKKVFRNSISTTDMNTLAPQLAAFVKKKLQRMMQRHDSNA